MASLSGFVSAANPATLDDCDREQIHFAGAILDEGAALVLDERAIEILAVSQNAASFLGMEPEQVFLSPFEELSPELSDATQDVILDIEIEREGIAYDSVAHAHDGKVFVEFIRTTRASISSLRQNLRAATRISADILAADEWSEALDLTVRGIRRITGFKRVKIYQFQPDWSGEVIAEDRDVSMPSFLGLRFPATDIPKQARELYMLTPARAVGNVHDRNQKLVRASEDVGQIDLTYSILRAVSPIHTQYLRNMGVESTFSMRLFDGDELWGLIACHHDEPGIVHYDSWGFVRELSIAFMARKDRESRLESAQKLVELRQLETHFAQQARSLGGIEEMIESIAPALQTFMGADGFAFQYGAKVYTSGETPPDAFISELILWANDQTEESDQFQTDELHTLWAKAKAHKDTACGVLIQPIFIHRVCQLVWFRGPITRTVNWAGQPIDKTGAGALTPRHSFDTWSEQNASRSREWLRSEIESAREILRGLLDIVAAKVLLQEENEDLSQFASKAAHDIKAPLRGIRMALDLIREDGTGAETLLENLEFADSSAETLDALTDGLLELMVLRNQKLDLVPVALDQVLESATRLLAVEIDNAQAEILTEPLPLVLGNDKLLIRVFLNLISNAIKYRSERAPKITVSSVLVDDHVEVSFRDNGTGIPQKYAKRVFQPLARLVASSEVTGAGLGLSICTRIMDAVDGAIWLDTDQTEGACFVLRFVAAEGVAG